MEKLNGFEIPEVRIPQIVNFGEKHKLEQISKNFFELRHLEQELLKQTTPSHLKNNISLLYNSFIIISIIILLIIFKIVHQVLQRRKLIKRLNDKPNEIIITPGFPLSSTSSPFIHSNSNCMPRSRRNISETVEPIHLKNIISPKNNSYNKNETTSSILDQENPINIVSSL